MEKQVQNLVWLVPEEQGGIKSYAEVLWPALRQKWASPQHSARLWIGSLSTRQKVRRCVAELAAVQPDLIHIQHEFGLFGSKIPGLYTFPFWLQEIRKALPQTRIIATAHTVLDQAYKYPVGGRGWQVPFRGFANAALIPIFRKYWLEETWSALDGVIVHSATQVPVVRSTGCPRVEVIPHFVPQVEPQGVPATDLRAPVVMVFGYFSPEKGQDIVIRAFAQLQTGARLVLAGGVRRSQDQGYFDSCQKLIRDLGLQERIQITGFVPSAELDQRYREATLAVAPFRETSGSGSLAYALARGAAILASDLPLNLEINEREAGTLAFFQSEDAGDCANKIDDLLFTSSKLESLRAASLRYALANSSEVTAERHSEFYTAVISAT